MGHSISVDCRIFPGAHISNFYEGGKITIGKGCIIHPYVRILTYGGDITLGINCSLNSYSTLSGAGGITMGNGVRIASYVHVVASSHIYGYNTDLMSSGITKVGILIRDNVWVGSSCVIADGSKLGCSVVVGANSFVRGELESDSLYAGNPVQKIRDFQHV